MKPTNEGMYDETPTNGSTGVIKKTNLEPSLKPLDQSVIPVDQINVLMTLNDDDDHLVVKINSMMERVTEGDFRWKCTLCGKCIKGRRAQMVRNMESHKEGVSHSCKHCGKISRYVLLCEFIFQDVTEIYFNISGQQMARDSI